MEARDTTLVGRRVLLIEDESLVTMLLEDTLADMGWEVVGVASRFQDAMEKAQSQSFDIAILDVNLNGQQSFPVAEILFNREIPFVFATGYGAASLPASLQRVPVVHKPFQHWELERALRAAVGVGT